MIHKSEFRLDTKDKILNILNEVRTEKKLSYAHLGRTSNRTRSFISHVFKDTRDPSLNTLIDLCYELDLELEIRRK